MKGQNHETIGGLNMDTNHDIGSNNLGFSPICREFACLSLEEMAMIVVVIGGFLIVGLCFLLWRMK